MKSTFLKRLTWLHTWSGLVFGVVIVMLGVTGAGLVLRPELDALVNRHLLKVPPCTQPLPVDILAARAMDTHSGRPVSTELSTDPTDSMAFQFANQDYVYVSPCTGDILGVQNQYGGFFGTMDWLHRFLFVGPPAGRPIAGWISLIFLTLLIAGGIVLWWPRAGMTFKTAGKFNYRLPGVARTLSLHKFIGLYTSILLLVITITAIPLSFLTVKNLIYHLTGYTVPVPPHSMLTADRAGLPIQIAWRESRRVFPDLQWAAITWPVQPADAIRVEVLESNAPHKDAKSYVYLDQYSGRVLRTVHYATDINIGRKIYLYCIATHSALVGGLPYQLLLLLACLGIPIQAWSGFSPYLRRKLARTHMPLLELRVESKTTVAEDVVSLTLVHPRGRRLPSFSAGAHIDVHLDNGLIRQYSLCGDPRDNTRYTIGVLRVTESRGGSIAVHEVRQGDTISVSRPKNFFPLDNTASRSLLLAGGIGITPLLSMAEHLTTTGAGFSLHYCVHSEKRAAFIDRMRQSSYAQNIVLHASDTVGRVDFATLFAECDPETQIYICGPNDFTASAIAAAKAGGFADAQIHYEYFSVTARDISDNAPFDVKIASTGKVFHIPQDRTVTEVLADSGILIPTSCQEGVCGTCLTGVIEGEVEHNDVILGEADRINNSRFTPCCSRARGSMLVLDL
ncbi:MAG TPA: PepSY domain-containing protein [Pseudomonadales bacterium]|nr:PepSY domain-containing protein [Pseudomonadales bacterium]